LNLFALFGEQRAYTALNLTPHPPCPHGRSTSGPPLGGALTCARGPLTYLPMLDLATAPEPKTAPAKRWRNYYRVYHVLSLARVGTIFPGIHAGPDTFPSQEIAEQKAKGFLALLNPPGRWLMDHAGAFPEGDKAN
jgi:hypothetical protein